MTVLIDTNVIIDYLMQRKGLSDTSTEVISYCAKKEVIGYIAGHTVLNSMYILRNSIPDQNARRSHILKLLKFLKIADITERMLISSLKNPDFKDYEDCVQSECALRINADYIVTRNVRDFTNSMVKAVTPEDFISIIGNKENTT